MIKAVLFDFGGVLSASGTKGFIARTIGALYDVPPEQLDIGEWHYKLRCGIGDEADFFAELNERYGKQVTREQYLAKSHAEFRPLLEVYGLAHRLRDAGIRTGILSNIFKMDAERLREEGLYDGFDPLILSYEEGRSKPDPELYAVALRKAGVTADELLFVDDQDKCLPPAAAMGIHTIQAITPEQTVADVVRVIYEQNGIDLTV
jgi:putative hydrolase of the HAD superfamily